MKHLLAAALGAALALLAPAAPADAAGTLAGTWRSEGGFGQVALVFGVQQPVLVMLCVDAGGNETGVTAVPSPGAGAQLATLRPGHCEVFEAVNLSVSVPSGSSSGRFEVTR